MLVTQIVQGKRIIVVTKPIILLTILEREGSRKRTPCYHDNVVYRSHRSCFDLHLQTVRNEATRITYYYMQHNWNRLESTRGDTRMQAPYPLEHVYWTNDKGTGRGSVL